MEPIRARIAATLKAKRKAAGYNVDQVGEKLGKSGKTISAWEVGRGQPDGDELILLCDLLNADISDFYGIKPQTDDSYFVDVPLYGSIAAGTPLEMIPVDDTYPAPRVIVEQYPDGFWLKIASNSMDLLFPVGTLVYVNPMKDIRVNGKPYAVCVNGFDATVKLVDKLANGFKLTPASSDPTYTPTIYDYNVPGTDKITIIGEIVYDMKPFDWKY